MRHLNYTHLLYFWSVVREGGVAAAALHITPQTVSGQVKLLEDQLQGALFEKQGRRLVPTELGRIAYAYADEIFPKGLELASVLRGARTRGSRQVAIGVADAVPKLVTWRVLEPLLSGDGRFHVICHEAPLPALLADLAAHRLDLVLATSAVPSDSSIKAFSHLLGESELGFFAAKPLAARLRRNFPHSLHDAPVLVPTDRSVNRRVLDAWFERCGITPRIVNFYIDYHARETFRVVEQTVVVSPGVADLVARRVKAYGAVPKAQCARSVSDILRGVPGFESIGSTWYPNRLMEDFGRLPGVTSRIIYDEDADKNHGVLLVQAGESPI